MAGRFRTPWLTSVRMRRVVSTFTRRGSLSPWLTPVRMGRDKLWKLSVCQKPWLGVLVAGRYLKNHMFTITATCYARLGTLIGTACLVVGVRYSGHTRFHKAHLTLSQSTQSPVTLTMCPYPPHVFRGLCMCCNGGPTSTCWPKG